MDIFQALALCRGGPNHRRGIDAWAAFRHIDGGYRVVGNIEACRPAIIDAFPFRKNRGRENRKTQKKAAKNGFGHAPVHLCFSRRNDQGVVALIQLNVYPILLPLRSRDK